MESSLKEIVLTRVGDHRPGRPAYVCELSPDKRERFLAFNLPEGVFMASIKTDEPIFKKTTVADMITSTSLVDTILQ